MLINTITFIFKTKKNPNDYNILKTKISIKAIEKKFHTTKIKFLQRKNIIKKRKEYLMYKNRWKFFNTGFRSNSYFRKSKNKLRYADKHKHYISTLVKLFHNISTKKIRDTGSNKIITNGPPLKCSCFRGTVKFKTVYNLDITTNIIVYILKAKHKSRKFLIEILLGLNYPYFYNKFYVKQDVNKNNLKLKIYKKSFSQFKIIFNKLAHKNIKSIFINIFKEKFMLPIATFCQHSSFVNTAYLNTKISYFYQKFGYIVNLKNYFINHSTLNRNVINCISNNFPMQKLINSFNKTFFEKFSHNIETKKKDLSLSFVFNEDLVEFNNDDFFDFYLFWHLDNSLSYFCNTNYITRINRIKEVIYGYNFFYNLHNQEHLEWLRNYFYIRNIIKHILYSFSKFCSIISKNYLNYLEKRVLITSKRFIYLFEKLNINF